MCDDEEVTNGEVDNTKKLDFDNMLDLLGGWGRYQIRLLCVFVPFTFFLAYVGYAPILYLYAPDHWCMLAPQHQNNSFLEKLLIPVDPINGERSKCYIYDVTYLSEEVLASLSNTLPTWQQVKCKHGWKYNYTGYFHSATTQFDWVCDDAWRPAFTQSMFYLGAIFGTIIFGWTADHYGRYWTLLSSNCIVMLTGIATPFAVDFVTFTALRFIMGLGFNTFFMVFYMLTLEYVSKEKRALVGNLSLAIAMTIGGCYQPWVLKALGDWKPFHHILFSQSIIILLVPSSAAQHHFEHSQVLEGALWGKGHC